MISLFYIAFLVSVSSLPIKLLPKRNVNQSFVGLKTFTYWLSENNVKSGDLENDNFCGVGTLAMPKTPGAMAAINAMLAATDGGHTQTWNGKYAWLGAKKWSDSNTWSWLDGTSIGNSDWDANEPGSSGTAGSMSYQPFLGLVRKAGSNQGKWHDFHGQDQGDNGKEASVGQLAVCQSRPQYRLTDTAIKSTEMGHGDGDVCGNDEELAMPKTQAEQDRVCTFLQSSAKDTSTAWGGNYVWLGGYRHEGTNQKWRWSDGGPTSGTPIPLPGQVSLMNHSNWDANEPGHDEGGTGNGVQRFFGVKRDNGKWHDFHGNDQGSGGQEASVGFLALCQSTQPW